MADRACNLCLDNGYVTLTIRGYRFQVRCGQCGGSDGFPTRKEVEARLDQHDRDRAAAMPPDGERSR